ncbi:tyrosine-type recombinase/integrase [Bifidobacterium aerophilum]|nr:site-specific integrase [Bifidobacterium aerophilum]
MARAWIEDLWLTDDATSAERRSLSSAADPAKAKVSPVHRKARFGLGRRWLVYWMEPLPNGGLKRRKKSFAAKDDAEAWRTQVDDDMRSGRYVDMESGAHTFAEAAELWFATRTSVRPQSLERYRIDYRRYIEPRWNNTPVGSITTIQIALWVADLVRGDPITGRKPLKPNTMTMIRLVFRGALGVAVSQRWIMGDPSADVQWPKSQKSSKHVYLTTEQIDALAEACDRLSLNPRHASIAGDGTLILFLAYTGLRIGEAAALTVSDVDLHRHVVHVSKTRTGANGYWTGTGPTKNGLPRDVHFPTFLDARLATLAGDRAPSAPMFPNARGGWLTYNGWHDHRFKPAVRDADLSYIDGLTTHSLRHTYASMLIGHGADVKTVQRLMGHSSAKMTLDTYADLWPGNDRAIVSILDDVWAKTH